MKKKRIVLPMLILSMMLLIPGCGKRTAVGDMNPKFTSIKEDNIPETVQIVELNDSIDYYQMEIAKDAECVYFYSIGYDSNGKLADKSVITTMPVGMEASEKIVINATFPKASHPSYAVGFDMGDDGQEYYILEQDDKKGVKPIFVENKEDFFLPEE